MPICRASARWFGTLCPETLASSFTVSARLPFRAMTPRFPSATPKSPLLALESGHVHCVNISVHAMNSQLNFPSISSGLAYEKLSISGRFSCSRSPAMTSQLDELEARTIYILREAQARIEPLGMLWSIGKDSNALLWMARKAFFGRVPFPVIQLDTEMELLEVYEFRDRLVPEWGLDFHVETCPPFESIDADLPPAARAAARKTAGLKNLIARQGFRGVILGIRRDEQATRAKERVFSPRALDGGWDFRDQPAELWDQY